MLFIGSPSNLFLRLNKMRNFAEFIFASGRIWEHLPWHQICSAKINAATFYARKNQCP